MTVNKAILVYWTRAQLPGFLRTSLPNTQTHRAPRFVLLPLHNVHFT